MANDIIVDIGDMKISSSISDVIVTCALGSCIAVILYDPATRVGGILHFMLPSSIINPKKAESNPYIFADTGIPLLIKNVFQQGADRSHLTVKIAGGSNIIDKADYFNIGNRNFVAAKQVLLKNSAFIKAQDVGGVESRTVKLSIANGDCMIIKPGKTGILI